MQESGLYGKLISRWSKAVVRVWYEGERERIDRHLVDALYHCVEQLANPPKREEEQRRVRQNRNAIIGELRKGVAEAALDFLAPDLVLVDEFQRFKDVIELADKEKELAYRLFEGVRCGRGS